jgi:pyrroloquinoline quinone biosynthesis protein B
MGSAAGGGFPQWNCACPNCEGLRAGRLAATARTQEGVAVSADGERWVLLNASPDLRLQIERLPALHPRAPRESPIRAVVLTSGEVDHCLGLFSLREGRGLPVYTTARVRDALVRENALAGRLLGAGGPLGWRRLELEVATPVADAGGRPTGLVVEAVAVPGKPPRHLESVLDPDPEDTVGLRLRAARGGPVLAYVPGAAAVDDAVRRVAASAACLFFDGTFWRSNELADLGIDARRAEAMGHAPLAGTEGAIARLAALDVPRRILIHLNNTNPLLDETSPERQKVPSKNRHAADAATRRTASSTAAAPGT